MNNSIYRVCLDIHTTHAQTQLEVSKGDTAREIEFTLTSGGTIYPIANCTAIFRAKKPDGTVLYNNCEIVGDRIKYQLTSQTSADIGILQCELQLVGADSKLLTAPRFTIKVADTLYTDSEVESEDEFTALTSAIAATENLDVSVEKVGHVTTVTVTDKEGVEHSAEILDGAIGADSGTGYITDGTVQLPFKWTLVKDRMFLTLANGITTLSSVASVNFVFNNLFAAADLTSYCDVAFYDKILTITTIYVGTLEIVFHEGINSGSFMFKSGKIATFLGNSVVESNATADTYNKLKGKTLVFDFPI